MKRIRAHETLLALMCAAATAGQAQTLSSVQASASCSQYSIAAAGAGAGEVEYDLTLAGSETLKVTGSMAATPDSRGRFQVRDTKPLRMPAGKTTLSGSARLLSDGRTVSSVPIRFLRGTVPCSSAAPAASCTAPSSISSNFNGTSIAGGTYIWFNSNFKASGVPSSGATVSFTGGTIQFTADQPYTLSVPAGRIVFSPAATCATTTFDSLSNTWMTTVPLSGSDEIFLSGLAFLVPSSFAQVGGKVKGPVTWSGVFGTNTPGVTMNWKWSAAVYTTFSTDYNLIAVKPTHSEACAYPNSHHAGTPEGIDPVSGKPYTKFVTGGARGGGGSNFTGSWSGTGKAVPTCTNPETFCLTMLKEMQQLNGTFLPEPNWQFDVLNPNGTTSTFFTDTTGKVEVCQLPAGGYTVSEPLPENVSVIGLVVNGVFLVPEPTYSFTWAAGQQEPVILFQNTRNTPQ